MENFKGIAEVAGKVLHLDDDPEFLELIQRRLDDTGLDVRSCKTVDGASKVLEEESISCILSDYQLQETNGIEFLERVRQDYPDLPFVMLTSRGSEEVASKAIRKGASDYIQKGPDFEKCVIVERLKNAIARYRSVSGRKKVLERINDGFFGLDENGCFTYVNQRASKLLERDREDLIGQNLWDAFPDAEGTRFQEMYREAVEEQEPVRFQEPYPPLDAVFRVHIFPSKSGCSVYFRDVSGHKKRKQAIRRYERIVNNLPVGVYRLKAGKGGELVESNPELASIFDADSREDMMGREVRDFYINPGEREELRTCLQEDGSIQDFEVEQETLEGNRIWISVTAIKTEEDGEVYYDGIVQDITERKKMDFTEQIFDASPIGVTVVDEEGKVVRANDRLKEMMDLEDDIKGEDPCKKAVLEDEDGERVPEEEYPLKQTLRTGEPVEDFQARVRNLDRPLWVSLNTVPVETASGLMVLESAMDITASKRLTERLDERLESFSKVVSHDLRNPLNVAKGYLDLAREGGREEDFDRIEKALLNIESIAEGLSLMTKEREDLELEELSLENIFEEAHAYVSAEVDYSVDDVELEADRQSMNRLLGNLISNAVEHNEEEVEVELGSLDNGFYFQDDGKGIENKHEVFEYGYSESDGEGLGLAIVERIAELNGWTVDLIDSPEGGARFEFRD